MRIGLLHPTRKVWRPFRSPLEVCRCKADDALVTPSQASLALHAGHHIKSPVTVSITELILIWIGVIR